ncbi:helix-turn-helix domain-containing protein, partial [Providencia rettgeri]
VNVVSKNIGKKIKKLRLKYNLSGSNLAKVIGISQQQLSRYENGQSDISTSKIMIISIYFNVDVSYFFDE